MNKPRPEPLLPTPLDPRKQLNKFHRRLLATIIEGGSGSASRLALIRMILGRKRMRNTRLYARALRSLLGLEQAGYVVRRDFTNTIALTVEGWVAAMGNREGH